MFDFHQRVHWDCFWFLISYYINASWVAFNRTQLHYANVMENDTQQCRFLHMFWHVTGAGHRTGLSNDINVNKNGVDTSIWGKVSSGFWSKCYVFMHIFHNWCILVITFQSYYGDSHLFKADFTLYISIQRPILIFHNTSYRKVSCNFEAVRLVVLITASLWNLTGSSAAEVAVKFKSERTILNTNLAASRLHEILQ